jgi:hypothetical protein
MAISVPYAIAILQVMGSLQTSTRRLPFFIGQVIEFLIALERIEKFLGVDEIEQGIIEKKDDNEIGVKIVENSFYWGFDRPAPPKRGRKKNRIKHIDSEIEIEGSIVTQRSLTININESSKDSFLSNQIDTYAEKNEDLEGQKTTQLLDKIALQKIKFEVK